MTSKWFNDSEENRNIYYYHLYEKGKYVATYKKPTLLAKKLNTDYQTIVYLSTKGKDTTHGKWSNIKIIRSKDKDDFEFEISFYRTKKIKSMKNIKIGDKIFDVCKRKEGIVRAKAKELVIYFDGKVERSAKVIRKNSTWRLVEENNVNIEGKTDSTEKKVQNKKKRERSKILLLKEQENEKRSQHINYG